MNLRPLCDTFWATRVERNIFVDDQRSFSFSPLRDGLYVLLVFFEHAGPVDSANGLREVSRELLGAEVIRIEGDIDVQIKVGIANL